MPIEDFDAFLPFPTLQGFAAVARAEGDMEDVLAERLVGAGVTGRPRGEERDAAGVRQLRESRAGRGIEAADQGEDALVDQRGGVSGLADSQLEVGSQELRGSHGFFGGQEGALGGGGVFDRRQNLSEGEMACLGADEAPAAGPGESCGGELEKAAAAGHRSVYRYAAMCRASVLLTPRLGMAVPRSMPWGFSIQRIMLSAELGSWPPR